MEHFPSCLNNPLLWVTLSPKGEGEERCSKKKKQSETKKTGTGQALIDKSERNGEEKRREGNGKRATLFESDNERFVPLHTSV